MWKLSAGVTPGWRRALVAGVLSTCVLGVCATGALGATYDVRTTADNDGAGTCSPAPATCSSLRQAIYTIDASPHPPDVIDVAPGDYVLDDGTLIVTENMTIEGAGAATTTIDGNRHQVFLVDGADPSSVALDGMNVVDGVADQNGDGIGFEPDNTASLTLSDDVFSNDSTDDVDGGAIYFDDNSDPGTLDITDTTISGDTVGFGTNGGGIAFENNGAGTLTITGSTLSADGAAGGDGGGLYFDGTALTITNSTVSGNTAGTQGAGLYLAGGTTTLTNDTIADNSLTPAGVNSGAGIYGVGVGHVTAINTIVSGNAGAKPASTDDCDVPVSPGHADHSLENGTGCGFDLPSANPDLESLADNGGPTQTMALAMGSPAIDAGAGARCPATDQRGFPRPDVPGTACDVGAYESGGPPTASITTPAGGAKFAAGQVVHASYHCTAGVNGVLKPGGAGCAGPVPDGAAIDTSTPGLHSFTVVATDTDGRTGSTTSDYRVTDRPLNTKPPAITGHARAGDRLSCSTGAWANNPTSFAYAWSRDGTPLAGATSARRTVQALDEGAVLTCTVTASNASGGAAATSRGIKVPIPTVKGCPGPTGKLSGATLGLVKLGMTRSRARYLYRHHSNRGRQYQDFFCLTPIGIRVGYGSPGLLSSLPKSTRERYLNRVVWASTSDPFYSIDGVRAGESIVLAAATLHTEAPLRIGLNDWYLARGKSSTVVLKVRHGVVEEIGIASERLTEGRTAQFRFMKSFT